jgi:hypothetical protein
MTPFSTEATIGSVLIVTTGTFNAILRDSKTAPCDPCPDFRTTSQPGGRSVEDCDLCKPGYGTVNGTACDKPCGGIGVAATYGPPGRSAESPSTSNCQSCPAVRAGFMFYWPLPGGLDPTNPFKPDVVARRGAQSAGECLAEFAQMGDTAWYMGGTAAMELVSSVGFDGCVATCKVVCDCQYVTYDYNTAMCHMKRTQSTR